MSEDRETISEEKIAEKKDHWQTTFDNAEVQAKEAEKIYDKIAEDVEANINEVERRVSKALEE